jgi:hypothetical protein
METYIVRIYRREEDSPRILVGVVEEVGVEGNKAFTNSDELLDILNSKEKELLKSKRGRQRGCDERIDSYEG